MTKTIFQTITRGTLSKKVDLYFKKVKTHDRVPSLTGLALYLGCTRKNLTDYTKTDKYGDIIERAKLRCENDLEERMIKGTPPTGIIFILKNNYAWKDKVEVDTTLKGTLSLGSLFDASAHQAALEHRNAIEGEVITDEQLPDNLFNN